MKILLAYSSKYGTVEQCAKKLGDLLGSEAQVCNLDKEKAPPLAGFEAVVVGGSIYAGMLRKAAKQFCQQYKGELMQKKLGLFLCCATSPHKEGVKEYWQANFAPELLEHASAKEIFGGEFRYEKMKFLDKKIIGMINKQQEKEGGEPPSVDEAAIEAFAGRVQE